MYQELTKCPLCLSGHFHAFKSIKDHAVSKENFTLCRCNNCKLIFTNPRPTQNDIGKYYQFDNYVSHQDKGNNLINLLYKQVRKITLKTKIAWIKEYASTKGTLLDYGCGTGYFLREAKENTWHVTGIEPNQDARTIAQKFDINVYESLENLADNQNFDVITLFHVLEHIHDLNATIENICKKLKQNGVIFIAVPNHQSYDAKIYQDDWAAWDVPRHLYHFDQESMQHFASLHQLEIIGHKPMLFDSYYVSLLSSSYKAKHKLLAPINALLNGWKSNAKAKSNNNNSSILFILKKK
ncbi:class I SAM-dependent methyltransferase [Belliella kenyensis]|uniref:Class I SAM-dependent methyltransferase n=1 Tax=Belliella kenyensis TaxID=1472724 RepID=A0ABV8EPI5_9BACT|nr:class I SAM-dependent methyltransferase [Belliella kenyensis]MCH7401683.1 class I SAM-dependent methyltransferase [Belliella kenyensis]MDN3603039.1 class I SAM-dependent methyltransferase [Belliella kenyensis]